MKKIIELIKKLLGSGSIQEKIDEINQLDKSVNDQITDIKSEVKEIKKSVNDQITDIKTEVKEIEEKIVHKKRGPYKKKHK
jgi:archaellum component FlaC